MVNFVVSCAITSRNSIKASCLPMHEYGPSATLAYLSTSGTSSEKGCLLTDRKWRKGFFRFDHLRLRYPTLGDEVFGLRESGLD